MDLEARFVSKESEIFEALGELSRQCESWWVCLGSCACMTTSPFWRIILDANPSAISKLEYAVLGISPRVSEVTGLKRLHAQGVLRAVLSAEGVFEPNVYVFRFPSKHASLLISGVDAPTIFGSGIASAILVACAPDHAVALGVEGFLQNSMKMARLLTPLELDRIEQHMGFDHEQDDRQHKVSLPQTERSRNAIRHCLCCGENSSLLLSNDLVIPPYMGGKDEADNLQPLCGECRFYKSVSRIDFRLSHTPLQSPSISFGVPFPNPGKKTHVTACEKFIRRNINLFFRCGAVKSVQVRKAAEKSFEWFVELHDGNEPRWLQEYLPNFLSILQALGPVKNHGLPISITVKGAGDSIATDKT